MPVLSAGSIKVRQWIEKVLNQVIEEVAKGKDGEVWVALRRIQKYEAIVKQSNSPTKFSAKDHEVKYTWPGKTPDEAWRFACTVAVLNSIHSAICSGIVASKRDIYYGDPDLFGDQAVVDSLIDDIAHTCQVSRQDLFVSASPNGLFATPHAAHGQIQTISRSLPFLAPVAWILVVEKEAVFNTLYENSILNRCQAGQGMVVTAKGYPDLATRHFLRSCLDSPLCSAQLYGLFDFDAYGIDILKCYRVGSKASASEGRLNLPEMKWLGLKSTDIAGLSNNAPIISLSTKDRTKATKLIEITAIRGHEVVQELRDCRDELQRMLMLNKRAEIEILEEGLSTWIDHKITASMVTV